MTSVHLLRRLHRVVLAGLLAAAISGVPAMTAQLAGAVDDCAEDCDGGLGGKSCPPNCSDGTCAKVFPTIPVLPVVASPPGAATLRSLTVPADAHVVERRDGIFHPPRV